MFARARKVLKNQLQQGLTIHQASLAIAIGLVCGVFPVIGCSTVVCLITAALLGLNQPIVLAFNLLSVLPKLALIVPFLRFGEWLYRAPPLAFDITAFTAEWVAAPVATSQMFAMSFAHVLTGWAVLAVPLIFLIYSISRPFVGRVARLRTLKSSR